MQLLTLLQHSDIEASSAENATSPPVCVLNLCLKYREGAVLMEVLKNKALLLLPCLLNSSQVEKLLKIYLLAFIFHLLYCSKPLLNANTST